MGARHEVARIEGSTPFGSTCLFAYLTHFRLRHVVADGCSGGCWFLNKPLHGFLLVGWGQVGIAQGHGDGLVIHQLLYGSEIHPSTTLSEPLTY